MYFEYSDKEISYLSKKDKKFAYAIETIGFVQRPIDNDIFTAVIRAIIGQQVSRKSRETVFKRIREGLNGINAKSIHFATVEDIQAFGTTFKKAEYIKDFAQKVYDEEIDLDVLHTMSDKEVITELSKLKGIGVWTAEMLLSSALKRMDIFSFGDIAIHRGLRMLYRHKDISKELFEKYRKRYSPYGTVASVYLWAIAAGAIPELYDPKDKKKVYTQVENSVDYF